MLFSIDNVHAESVSEEYCQLYQASGADELEGSLDNETKVQLERYDIDIEKPETIWSLNAFDIVYNLIKGSIVTQGSFFNVLSAMLIFTVIYAVTSTFSSSIKSTFASFEAVSCAVCALVLLLPISALAMSAAEAISSMCVFMNAFIPIYGGTVLASGAASTAGSYSALMYGVTQIYAFISDSVLVPLSSMMLTSSVGAAFGSITQKFSELLKRTILTVMSIAGALFLTVLSLQTAIATPSDSLGLKTIKTTVGTFVPIVGGMLSETISAIVASGMVLKSSIGTYAIICLVFIVVPIVIKLLLWRMTAALSAAILQLAGAQRPFELVRSVGGVMTILICIVLGVAASYILSVILTLSVGR